MEETFSRLVEQYQNLVWSLCYKMTNDYFEAQDLAQETFLSVYKNLTSFDGQNERAWICKIATNKCLDHLKRAASRSQPAEESFFNEMEGSFPSPEDSCMEVSEQEKLLSLCKSLKQPYDQIAIDYFYHEMTAKDMAEHYNKNLKTVQTQIYRAKNMLKKLWRRE
ncbi:RNA polymerase sigma factor [Acetivibrio ethanolgignens]|uniref:RNA polymerase sigma factor n=1 Tax=Acetivibrio ethanolgignens TaxID=290052 RepID=A0A0V8QFU0_9FIRM|nr:sigma-70 family RNA polymerase sigma factor [Acetivibrio ethanolgignens]KSV59340.1 RNA polymerase subunit sigma-70 [Acetivibrio ethanolgignens]